MNLLDKLQGRGRFNGVGFRVLKIYPFYNFRVERGLTVSDFERWKLILFKNFRVERGLTVWDFERWKFIPVDKLQGRERFNDVGFRALEIDPFL